MGLLDVNISVAPAKKDRRNGIADRLHIDLPLMLVLLLLSGTSLVILYSAGGQDLDLIMRQAVRLGIAFIIMILLAQIAPYHLHHWAPRLFAVGLVLLFSVLFFGETGKGAQRWLDLGVFRFQPSELMKIAVPMMVAWYLAERPLPPRLPCSFSSLFLG